MNAPVPDGESLADKSRWTDGDLEALTGQVAALKAQVAYLKGRSSMAAELIKSIRAELNEVRTRLAAVEADTGRG